MEYVGREMIKSPFTSLGAAIIVLCSCSSTQVIHLNDSARLNAQLTGQDVAVELKDGKELLVIPAAIRNDSVLWMDRQTHEETRTSIHQINKLIIFKNNRVLGALEGLTFGIIGGVGIGWLITARKDYDEGLLLYNMLVQAGIWGGVGIISGAIIGHTDNLEYRFITREGVPWKVPIEEGADSSDVLYLRNGEVIRGIIIAEVQEGEQLVYVAIRFPDGKTHTYYVAEIDRIEKRASR